MDEYIWPKIKKDTSIDELKEIHRRIWDYVIANYYNKPMTPYMCDCVACEYTRVRQGHHSCEHCPIKWPDEKGCSKSGSMYDTFHEYSTASKRCGRHLIEAMQYAVAIRDVEWKENDHD